MKFNWNLIRNRALNTLQGILDSDLAETITYKMKDTSSGSNPPGEVNPSYDNYSITVIKSNTALESQASTTIVSAIGFETGEQFFITRYDELPRDPYSKDITSDIIEINGSERQIKKAVPVFDVMVKLRV